jgi:hypothetical protein
MTNPFSGLINAAMKQQFNNAIDAMLEDAACVVPCTITYGDTKFTDCPNCIFSSTTGRSSNRYQTGGPAPFSFGQCPVCYGEGRIPDVQTSEINLALIWDYRDWYGWNGADARTLASQGMVQSISRIDLTLTDIKRANFITLNTDLSQYVNHKFTREGEPTPIGFGDDRYIMTMWKAVE